jgi:predicted ATPase
MMASDTDFSAHPQNLSTITAICRRLDGIPLAIEFAAACAATLGLQHVAARLDDRFRLLTAGRRTALPRHRTLRATLDWSYELLPESERCLLRRLAIFAAGFTLEAATAVMTDIDNATSAVVEGIANLVSKSLVTLDASASPGRWRLLETIRAYAHEKLAESGQAEQVARRHAEFFRDLFAPVAPGFSQPKPTIEDMAHYGREIDNIRAALDWSFSAAGDTRIGLELTAAYVPMWMHFALVAECRERVERALASIEPHSSAPLRMQLQIALGTALIITTGSVERSRMALIAALEVAESLDDVDAQLRPLWALWALDFQVGDCRAAQFSAERFSRIADRIGDRVVVPVADRIMGYTLH